MDPDSHRMIQPDTPISVTLPAHSWNTAMQAMAEGIGAAQQLLGDIQRQCMAADRPPFPVPQQRPNGEDVEERRSAPLGA